MQDCEQGARHVLDGSRAAHHNLSAAALLGAALLAPMSTATAAGETCQGQAATMDTMGLVACRVHVNGGPGKDVIKHVADHGDSGDEEGNMGLAAFGVNADLSTPKCGTYRAVIFGGRGRDTIVGGPGKDRLLGGPGKDRVNGGPRRHVCQGERGRDCEKRV